MDCDLLVEKEGYYQLPFYYYPKMVQIKINNRKTPYVATPHFFIYKGEKRKELLISVYLKPGVYRVESIFTGIIWANWVTLITCFLLFSISISMLFKKLFILRKNKIYYELR